MVMIDDKKIEEAARYYCNNRYPASQDAPFIEEGFRHGAKWAINELVKNLWHPASEVPEIGRVIIMENHYPDGRIEFPSHMRKFTSHNPIDGETQKWFYIGDLFPKERGENG